jgi:hypothetical protein
MWIYSSKLELFILLLGTLIRNKVSDVLTPKLEKMDYI